MIRKEEKKLYRKEKKTGLSRSFYVTKGKEYRHERRTKSMLDFAGTFKPMNSQKLGYDYTPLYRFLLTQVGCKWDEVYSEAKRRLDKEDPIFYMVMLNPLKKWEEIVCLGGENSYWSGLTVEDNILVKINPDAIMTEVHCTCCTHTFNGEVIHSNQALRH